MPHPALSVVMPVRNGARFVREAVDSVLQQSLTNYQFIVVDDGSTDGADQIIRDAARLDPRIEIVHGPRSGIVGALNAGLAHATARYVARMDADDLCLPGRFERQVEYLDGHPECVLVGSRVLLVDEDGLPIKEWCEEETHEEIDHAHMNWGWPVVHPAVTMRRDAIEAVGGYREKYAFAEDLDLFLRLAEIGRLCNLPQVLLKYRKHLNSICQQHGEEQARLRIELYQEAYRRRGLSPDSIEAPKTQQVRPGDLHRLWGWWALQSGYLKTARKHAVATLRQMPASLESWRLMFCAIRGH